MANLWEDDVEWKSIDEIVGLNIQKSICLSQDVWVLLLSRINPFKAIQIQIKTINKIDLRFNAHSNWSVLHKHLVSGSSLKQMLFLLPFLF